MEITLQISSLIIIVLGITGVVLALSTAAFCQINRRSDDFPISILCLLLVSIGLTLLNETLTTSGISNRFKNLYFLPLNFSLSIAPLFYLFVKSKIKRQLTRIDLVHLILPVIQFSVFLLIGFLSVPHKSILWNNSWFRLFLNLETILFVAGLIFYGLLSYMIVNKSTSDQVFWKSDLKKWLLRMVRVFLFLALLELFLFIGEILVSSRFGQLFYVFRTLLFVMIIGWVVYNTIKLLYPKSIYRSLPQSKPVNTSEFQKLEERINSLMNKEKVYLNPDLSLGLLAKYLDTSEKNCSKLFSSTLNSNFKSYINKYRVEEFKNRLSSGKYNDLTILGIAFDCGFDSKTTFNRVFKKLEGLTPSKFRDSIKPS